MSTTDIHPDLRQDLLEFQRRAAEIEALKNELRELGLQLGDAHAEIRELKAEIGGLKSAAETWHKRYLDRCTEANDGRAILGQNIVGLEAEIEALKADAKRYQWLRDINAFRLNDFGVWCFYAGMNLRGQNLDDAIDAAIAQKETP